MSTNRFLINLAQNRNTSFLLNIKTLNCIELSSLLIKKSNEMEKLKDNYCDYDEFELISLSREYDIIQQTMKKKKCNQLEKFENIVSQTTLSEHFSEKHFNDLKNNFQLIKK